MEFQGAESGKMRIKTNRITLNKIFFLNKILFSLIVIFMLTCSKEEETPPLTISEIPNQKANINQDLGPINFNIVYNGNDISIVTIEAESDNKPLIPDENISISGSGAERSILIEPKHNESGKAKISLLATDGTLSFEKSFEVRIVPTPGSWKIVETGFANDVNRIFFHDTLKGWTVGDNGLLMSSMDGGITWNKAIRDFQSENFNDIFFTNRKNGFIASTWHEGEVVGGQIISTIDSGKTWTQKITFPAPLHSIQIFMGLIGWATGDNGLVAISPDGGGQWITREVSGKENLLDVFFINDKRGWVVGEKGAIYVTGNSGAEWTKQAINIDVTLNSVFFIDELNGFACGDRNTLIKTETGGIIWLDYNPSIGFPTDEWKDVFFINDKAGWLIGIDGRIYQTKNGGSSWDFQQTGTTKDMSTVFMLNEGLGWIGGVEGTILKYE